MAGKKTKKILIIDADQNDSEHLKALLESKGYEVELAYTSEQGYAKVEFFQPDLIILEVMLEEPDSGFWLARKIKNHPVLGNVPIFIYTAVAEKTGGRFSLEEDGYWMKVDDFADKPLKEEEFLSRVERLISGKKK